MVVESDGHERGHQRRRHAVGGQGRGLEGGGQGRRGLRAVDSAKGTRSVGGGRHHYWRSGDVGVAGAPLGKPLGG